MISFHIIYTPGTIDRLLPLATTLLQAGEAGFILVDNACESTESRKLEALAATEPRYSYSRMPGHQTRTHGDVLNHLLARCTEPWFGVLDSDVLASGDFVPDLGLPGDGCAGIFAAAPVWRIPALSAVDPHSPFLGGPVSTLMDGTPIGATPCAVYDREALQAAVSKLPLGLCNGPASRLLPRGMKNELRARGWSFRRFGTARLAHLRLLLDDFSLVNVETRHLHHIGGISHEGEIAHAPLGKRLRRFSDRMLHGSHGPLVNAILNAPTVLQRLTPDEERQAGIRRLLTRHAGQTLDRLCAERAVEAPPITGVPEVDGRYHALHEAVVKSYPGGSAFVRGL